MNINFASYQPLQAQQARFSGLRQTALAGTALAVASLATPALAQDQAPQTTGPENCVSAYLTQAEEAGQLTVNDIMYANDTFTSVKADANEVCTRHAIARALGLDTVELKPLKEAYTQAELKAQAQAILNQKRAEVNPEFESSAGMNRDYWRNAQKDAFFAGILTEILETFGDQLPVSQEALSDSDQIMAFILPSLGWTSEDDQYFDSTLVEIQNMSIAELSRYVGEPQTTFSWQTDLAVPTQEEPAEQAPEELAPRATPYMYGT